ncbi:MAG TPA: hypothetical protein VG226_10475, partial [Acidimicrobiales bacterium]|nr:hypothetical protein [Acidimicrobiales bacterium]
MATMDQRSKRKDSRGPAARDTARSTNRSKNRSGASSSGASDASPSRPDVSAEAVAEAISLLESFLADFEPGRYSGEDAAVLVERFSRGEHLCATGRALSAKRASEAELFRKDGHR